MRAWLVHDSEPLTSHYLATIRTLPDHSPATTQPLPSHYPVTAQPLQRHLCRVHCLRATNACRRGAVLPPPPSRHASLYHALRPRLLDLAQSLGHLKPHLGWQIAAQLEAAIVAQLHAAALLRVALHVGESRAAYLRPWEGSSGGRRSEGKSGGADVGVTTPRVLSVVARPPQAPCCSPALR